MKKSRELKEEFLELDLYETRLKYRHFEIRRIKYQEKQEKIPKEVRDKLLFIKKTN